MSLWVDRYRPLALADMELHRSMNVRLRSLASTSMPHLLFYGPNGAGKRSRMMAFLRELFGDGVYRVKVSDRSFRPVGAKSDITLSTLHSNYHIELNPSDVGNNDRHVIQHLLREIAESRSVRPLDHTNNNNNNNNNNVASGGVGGFKVVVINGADRMSRDAQAALRRTMEKYMEFCRVIMCCEHLTHIIEPIQSRCQLIRVPAPQPTDLAALLKSVALAEGLELTDKDARNLVTRSDRNIRHALVLLQSIRPSLQPAPLFKKNHPPASTSTTTTMAASATTTSSASDVKGGGGGAVGVGMGTDWEETIDEMAREILANQSIQVVQWCRERLLELLSHLIPAELILKTLVEALHRQCNDLAINTFICKLAAESDIRLAKATKPILHLEFFYTHLIAHLASLPVEKNL